MIKTKKITIKRIVVKFDIKTKLSNIVRDKIK
jgi:hypothetical protein